MPGKCGYKEKIYDIKKEKQYGTQKHFGTGEFYRGTNKKEQTQESRKYLEKVLSWKSMEESPQRK